MARICTPLFISLLIHYEHNNQGREGEGAIGGVYEKSHELELLVPANQSSTQQLDLGKKKSREREQPLFISKTKGGLGLILCEFIYFLTKKNRDLSSLSLIWV
ncbi:unnamed protein product [Camellia sinensis]